MTAGAMARPSPVTVAIVALGGIMVLTLQFDSAPFYGGTNWIYVPWLGLLPTLLALVLPE